MWRRLLSLAHPDRGGDHSLFIWVQALREYIAGDGIDPPRRGYEHPRRPTTTDTPRVPYEEAFERAGSFDGLTRYAVAMAADVGDPYGWLLRLLDDCYEAPGYGGVLYRQQHQGATYRQLAAIGHRAGMSKQERTRWYRIAESIPLSQRHAGHILCRLRERAA